MSKFPRIANTQDLFDYQHVSEPTEEEVGEPHHEEGKRCQETVLKLDNSLIIIRSKKKRNYLFNFALDMVNLVL